MCDRAKFSKGEGLKGGGLIVDPIVHQAALNRCDLGSAEIGYSKHEVAPPYLYTMFLLVESYCFILSS